jgi:uncharacterized lipoprotein YehR (DUF1307 family)
MKTIKSLLVVVMVLVIGVCLTGCQTAEEKAYGDWVYSLDYIPGMLNYNIQRQ